MKAIQIFGTWVYHKPTLDKEKMKINGFDYSKEEILEALKKKGYNIVEWNYHWQDETFPNGKSNEVETVQSAVKENELPTKYNIWFKVAEREFKKKKPALI